jgi:hypothetical protein
MRRSVLFETFRIAFLPEVAGLGSLEIACAREARLGCSVVLYCTGLTTSSFAESIDWKGISALGGQANE